jgi:hypothetical protein
MIALLPLDSRPCNTDRPLRLASLAGADLLLPPRELLDRYTRPGRPDLLESWLWEQARSCGNFIINLEMLLYGGLIASRSFSTTSEEAGSRLQMLYRLKEQQPDISLTAFGVILRSTITVSNDADMDVWRLMPLYSELLGRMHSGEKGLKCELQHLEERIPLKIRERYLSVRRRNHHLNIAAVKAVSDGVLDYLVLGQEDATSQGLHCLEQAEIMDIVARSGLSDRVTLLNGADELGALLIVRALGSVREEVAVEGWPDASWERIARYENMTIRDNLERHLHVLGWSVGVKSDMSLMVNLPHDDEMPDIFLGEEASPTVYDSLYYKIDNLLNSKAKVGLIDLAAANGADDRLMSGLADRGALGRLSAFAGWNTAGNSIGYALAHLGALTAAEKRREQEEIARDNAVVLLEEYADDWIYQSRCRAATVNSLKTKGISPFNLGPYHAEVEAELQTCMVLKLRQLEEQVCFSAGNKMRWDISLPWPRLFEARIRRIV